MQKKILVIFYSHSGNTKKLAEAISRISGGVFFEIKPEVPYPKDYNKVVEQAKIEIKNDFRPALKTKIDDLENYGTILIGTPNWWSTMAPPVATFLGYSDLAKKTVVPFYTHGGGGSGNIERDMAKLCPDSKILPGLSVYGGSVNDTGLQSGGLLSEISAWLQRISVI